VGGGYDGKSTVLEALEGSVYDDIGNDGGEFVIRGDEGMKIGGEDGGGIENVKISGFIDKLGGKKDRRDF
uniref:ABC-ATPase domain-containing protein n=1 Tax=Staphylococcus haemolyticus TaxID=1283 RepID=UPI0021B3CA6C